MQAEGVFGIISGMDYACDEILPAYYQRQDAEQIFDFAKNYTKLLPVRSHTEETFQGHLLLSYIATCTVKMMQLRLKTAGLYMGSRLMCMRNQKCTIYTARIVTDNPQKVVNDTYKSFQISCPSSIPVIDGRLQYDVKPAKSEGKRKRNSKKALQKTGEASSNTDAAPKKKRGRPPKPKDDAEPSTPKKRGRPRKNPEQNNTAEPRKRRGRPKKSGTD